MHIKIRLFARFLHRFGLRASFSMEKGANTRLTDVLIPSMLADLKRPWVNSTNGKTTYKIFIPHFKNHFALGIFTFMWLEAEDKGGVVRSHWLRLADSITWKRGVARLPPLNNLSLCI